jgi:hypothetical protein
MFCFVSVDKISIKMRHAKKDSASHTNPKKNHSVNVGFGNQRKYNGLLLFKVYLHPSVLPHQVYTMCFFTKQVKQQLQIVRGFKIPQTT